MVSPGNADWPLRDRTTWRHPFVDHALELPLHLAWRTKLAASVFAQAIVSGKYVVVASLRRLHCLNLSDGSIVWEFSTKTGRQSEESETIKSTPAAHNGVVYATDFIGTLYAIDLGSGEAIWESEDYQCSNEHPLVFSQSILVKSRQRIGDEARPKPGYSSIDFDARPNWFFEADDLIFSDQPAVQDGVLVFGCRSGSIYGVDAVSGQAIWNSNVASIREMENLEEPAAYGPTTIVGSKALMRVGNGQYFAAFDIYSGECEWVHHAGALAVNMACDEQSMFYITHDGMFRSVDLATGKTAFETDNREHQLGTSFSRSALVVGGNLVAGFGESHTLAIFRTQDGQLAWSYETGGILNASAAFASHRILVGSDDAYIYCFEESD